MRIASRMWSAKTHDCSILRAGFTSCSRYPTLAERLLKIRRGTYLYSRLDVLLSTVLVKHDIEACSTHDRERAMVCSECCGSTPALTRGSLLEGR